MELTRSIAQETYIARKSMDNEVANSDSSLTLQGYPINRFIVSVSFKAINPSESCDMDVRYIPAVDLCNAFTLGSARIGIGTVSYTHLTLPTICSV